MGGRWVRSVGGMRWRCERSILGKDREGDWEGKAFVDGCFQVVT